MRGMIVAAGLGSRLSPLTEFYPKPALPIRGIPLIAHGLTYLKSQGVTEVVINTHHLAKVLERTAREWCPKDIKLFFSHEERLLGTGGGIGSNWDFLRESKPAVIIGGDMLIDFDLKPMLNQHQNKKALATLLLKEDDRSLEFGSIGIDELNCIRRVSHRFHVNDSMTDSGCIPSPKSLVSSEARSGLYTWVNLIDPRAFDYLPKLETFSHLDDWLLPILRTSPGSIQAWLAQGTSCSWQPVGTILEYWNANLDPIKLSYSEQKQLQLKSTIDDKSQSIIGRNAIISPHATLDKMVIWDNETVPAGNYQNGIFAFGKFHKTPFSPRDFRRTTNE